MAEAGEGESRGRWSAAACIAGLVPAPDRELIYQGPMWTHFSPREAAESPVQGWKLHISARAASIHRITAKALPLLLAARVPFKVARSQAVLTEINEGMQSPATVGKALTVYPPPEDFVRLANQLADALAGEEGPRVLSDRRVRDDAPVYYRYGPFAQDWRLSASGEPEIALVGPAGQAVDGLAGLAYTQPDWVDDPFGRPADDPRGTVLGGRYQVTDGLQQSPRGDVYRAVDTDTGRRVIVKQARAFVSEDGEAPIDVRTRLRNERRILEVLADHPGVPRLIDHFAHGPDEYLVVSEVPGRTLFDVVFLEGRFRAGLGVSAADDVWQNFRRLASHLLASLRRMHQAGVVLRDISPRNIMVAGDAAAYIDFGISSHDNFWLPGGTPGFCPPHQLREARRPVPDDDIHALTRVLLFARSGVMPVVGCTDQDWSEAAYRRQVAATGCMPEGELADLLTELRGPAEVATAPPGPVVQADRTRDRLLSRLMAEVTRRLDSRETDYFHVDTSIYTGMAGIGRELVRECGRDEAAMRLVGRIAERCVDVVASMGVPDGLMVGATGVEIFLAEARQHGIAVPALRSPGPPSPASPVDLVAGGIGIALGLLELARLGSPASGDAAVELITRLLADPARLTPDVVEDLPPRSGVDKRLGAAHGFGGLIECLACAILAGADQFREPLEALVAKWDGTMTSVHDDARSRSALPISASWCQGLAGVARVYVGAGVALGSDDLIRRGRAFLASALDWVPRLENVTMCCGMAGIASAALDVGEMLGTTAAAKADIARVLDMLCLRSTRPEELDLFALQDGAESLSLGLGLAGLVNLLRRVDGGGPGFLPSPLVPLASRASGRP